MSRAFSKAAPRTGIPGGAASRFLRADYRTAGSDDPQSTEFDALIETKSPRLGWARAAVCPCTPINAKTQQPDPNCPQCNALGFTYFRPTNYAVDAAGLGALNHEQAACLEKAKGVLIRGSIVSMTHEPDMFRALGEWAFGSAMITVRAQNVLGYYDRIISLDQKAAHTERVFVSGDGILKTRYSVVALNALQSLTTVYGEADVKLDAGVVKWRAGREPEEGTILTVHYLYHPVWLAMQHAHVMRGSLIDFKKPRAKLQTPQGDWVEMPSQAMLRLEHLELAEKGRL